MTVFVAVNSKSEIVGTIVCSVVSSEEGHARHGGVAVEPGNGVAAQLLRQAERELRSCGCARVTLDTTEPLEPAICFYEGSGYQRSGRVSDFFGMPLIEYQKTPC